GIADEQPASRGIRAVPARIQSGPAELQEPTAHGSGVERSKHPVAVAVDRRTAITRRHAERGIGLGAEGIQSANRTGAYGRTKLRRGIAATEVDGMVQSVQSRSRSDNARRYGPEVRALSLVAVQSGGSGRLADVYAGRA